LVENAHAGARRTVAADATARQQWHRLGHVLGHAAAGEERESEISAAVRAASIARLLVERVALRRVDSGAFTLVVEDAEEVARRGDAARTCTREERSRLFVIERQRASR